MERSLRQMKDKRRLEDGLEEKKKLEIKLSTRSTSREE